MAEEEIAEEIYEGYDEEYAAEPVPDYGGIVFAGTMDGKSYGFYLPESVIDGDGRVTLADYAVLSPEEHMALLDAQAAGKLIVFHPGAKPTLEDPPPPSDEEVASRVRAERDALIDEVEWRIQRYQQQSALGIETTDSAEDYAAILAYVQELRDITGQEGFPHEVTFPTLAV